jgi:hypothetical protein
MTDDLFRLLLDCMMQADRHPWTDADDAALTKHLDAESKARGYESWVVAYHDYVPVLPAVRHPAQDDILALARAVGVTND